MDDGKEILNRIRKYLDSQFKSSGDLRDYQAFQAVTWVRFTYDTIEEYESPEEVAVP